MRSLGPIRVRATRRGFGGISLVFGLTLAVLLPALSAMPLDARQSSASPVPVAIYPGQTIQHAVETYPAGTAFLIKAGVHVRQGVYPKDGMSFTGEPGAILDGENAAPYAFMAGTRRNVTVRGLRITRYAPPNGGSAVEGHASSGWIVEDNEIDHNSNGALRAYGVRVGSKWVLRGNRIHHNGWVGIAGYQAFATLIEGNEVYANPPNVFDDTIGEASNIKLYECGGITIRGNDVHDGPFRGIWLDRSEPGMTVEDNIVLNHGDTGIWFEVGYQAVIRRNRVENAGYLGSHSVDWLGGGGIQVTNSPDVSVLENTVVNSLNGIIGHQAAGYDDGPHGPSELRNLRVEGNTIVQPSGQSGITQNVGNNLVFVSWNNRFVGNTYQLQNNASPFRWMGLNLDEGQWSAYGQGPEEGFGRY